MTFVLEMLKWFGVGLLGGVVFLLIPGTAWHYAKLGFQRWRESR